MKELIEQLLSTAVSSLQQQGVIASDVTPRIQVDRTRDPTHGDFATNLAMLLAKGAGKPPRDMAALLIAALPPHAAVAKVEIAGPGFINLFAASDFQSQQLEAMLADGERAGVTPVSQPQTIVVDYSAPNVAKEMAVHHIRSTVIGDAVTRTLEFLGHKVIRANHIGDWGTQFGMLIAYLEKMENEHASDLQLADLEAFYREAKKHYDEDAAFAE
ncbi:MAG: arginine--tRNA ligase, partial [Corallincola sp.]|nr:arginine--tRNA ligase [Corallincola sp.]